MPPPAQTMRSTRALVLSAWLAVVSGTNEAFQTGNAHYARGELEEAREAYNECLREQPDRTDCATNLASVLIDLGPQHEAFAEALYRRVLAIDETHADAAFNLALLLQDRKTDEATRECVTLYQLVVAADPQLWDAWSNLASALTELKVPVQAVRASQRAIVLLEQAQQAAGGAPDDAADAMLGKLYFLLAMALVDLTAEQCAEVASSPDSLMVGVDEHGNAEEAGVPLAAVCHENALNAPRHVETKEPNQRRLGRLALRRLNDHSARSCLRLPQASASLGQSAAWAALARAHRARAHRAWFRRHRRCAPRSISDPTSRRRSTCWRRSRARGAAPRARRGCSAPRRSS